MLEVFVDGGVEVLGVALVKTVDLSLRLDLHIPLSQDELTDGLRNTNVMFRWGNSHQNKPQHLIY